MSTRQSQRANEEEKSIEETSEQRVNTFYIFSSSFDDLEKFCKEFHWNISSNYSSKAKHRMVPFTNGNRTHCMQFIWTQGSQLTLYFRQVILNSIQTIRNLRANQNIPEDANIYYIESVGAEVPKFLRDKLKEIGCRVSYFQIIYKRIMLDYQEVMKVNKEEEKENASRGVTGGSTQTSRNSLGGGGGSRKKRSSSFGLTGSQAGAVRKASMLPASRRASKVL